MKRGGEALRPGELRSASLPGRDRSRTPSPRGRFISPSCSSPRTSRRPEAQGLQGSFTRQPHNSAYPHQAFLSSATIPELGSSALFHRINPNLSPSALQFVHLDRLWISVCRQLDSSRRLLQHIRTQVDPLIRSSPVVEEGKEGSSVCSTKGRQGTLHDLDGKQLHRESTQGISREGRSLKGTETFTVSVVRTPTRKRFKAHIDWTVSKTLPTSTPALL